MRSLNQKLKEYELKLDGERKSEQQILQKRKKLEVDLPNVLEQVDEANKQKDETLCNAR